MREGPATAPSFPPIDPHREDFLDFIMHPSGAPKIASLRTGSPRLEPSGQPSNTEAASRLTLLWVVRLRWWAVAGQALTLGVASTVLEMKLPLIPLLVPVLLTALSNALLARWLTRLRPTPQNLLGAVLTLDTLLLTALLYWSGGPSNPFSVLYLVHITLAAIVLGARWTWSIVLLADVCFGLLFVKHVPLLEVHMHHAPGAFSLHLQGMWVAFALGSGLIAHFVGKVQQELQAREVELREARELAARNERLAGLTTLAAGAAHELGTPLGTIALVSKELELALQQAQSPQTLMDDARLIRSEVARCRAILDQLGARAGESVAEIPERVPVAALTTSLLEQLSPEQAARVQISVAPQLEQVIVPRHAIIQVLSGLIKNALFASAPSGPVILRLEADAHGTRFHVQDQGEGMTPEVLRRACDPFFTTKPPGQGMGIGLFLVRLFAERLSGQLILESTPGKGTTATLELPPLFSREVLP